MSIYQNMTENISKLKVDGKENNEFCWLGLEEVQNSKIDFRHKLLKDTAIKALTQKPIPLDLLGEY